MWFSLGNSINTSLCGGILIELIYKYKIEYAFYFTPKIFKTSVYQYKIKLWISVCMSHIPKDYTYCCLKSGM